MATPDEWIKCVGLPVAKCNGYRQRSGLPPLERNVPGQRLDHNALNRPRRQTPHGVGTELAGLFAELGEQVKATLGIEVAIPAGCTCGKLKAEMDRLTPAGCIRDKHRLVAAIRENVRIAEFPSEALRQMVHDAIPGLFDQAVQRAEANMPAKKKGCCGGGGKKVTSNQEPVVVNGARDVPSGWKNLTPAEKQARTIFAHRHPPQKLSRSHVRAVVDGKPVDANTGHPLDVLPFTGPITRHLHYFCWPVAGNGTWQHNLDQLLARIDLFNGRRRMAIAESTNGDKLRSDSAEAVKDYLRGHDFEFTAIRNDPRLREVAAFLDLLGPLESTDTNECVFFAHAKGVSHGPPTDQHKAEHTWASVMYQTCLDDWYAVEAALLCHAFAGSLRKFNQFKMRGHHRWHYAGTFYWARSAFIFSRRWRVIDKLKFGSETWPGKIATAAESACLFHDNTDTVWTLGYMREKVLPELEEWKRIHLPIK